MKIKFYAVYDKKALAYIMPFFMPNDGTAERAFFDTCNTEDHMFCKHPEDYSLYDIGSFEDTTGEVTVRGEPAFLTSAVIVQRMKEEIDESISVQKTEAQEQTQSK